MKGIGTDNIERMICKAQKFTIPAPKLVAKDYPTVCDFPSDVLPDGVVVLPAEQITTYSEIENAANVFGIASDLCQLQNGYVGLSGEYGATLTAMGDESGDIVSYPLVSAQVGKGKVAAFPFLVKGSDLIRKCESESSVHSSRLIFFYPIKKNQAANSAGKFTYVDNPYSDAADQTYSIIQADGSAMAQVLYPENSYRICAFVKDGGEYDWDGEENGVVKAAFILSNPEEVDPTKTYYERQFSGGGGCNAGIGYAALLLMIPAILVKTTKKK